MIHPATELRFISPEIGFGVFATELIPRGTITWILDEFDQVLSPETVAALAAVQKSVVEKYAYVDPQGNFVLCWDLGRYINHSCSPTSRGVGPLFEIALRDIHPREQLTSDYAESNLHGGFACRCGAASCRGMVREDDLRHYWHEWDALTLAAMPYILQVVQPLWPFVKDPEGVNEMLLGKRSVPSRKDYWPGADSNNGTPREAKKV